MFRRRGAVSVPQFFDPNQNMYSYVSNTRAVSNKHPGLKFALEKISVLYLIDVLA